HYNMVLYLKELLPTQSTSLPSAIMACKAQSDCISKFGTDNVHIMYDPKTTNPSTAPASVPIQPGSTPTMDDLTRIANAMDGIHSSSSSVSSMPSTAEIEACLKTCSRLISGVGNKISNMSDKDMLDAMDSN